MARMYGFSGKMSGKMGNAVFRVREGQQVLTQYNPIVKNPNTQAQQGTRARFKLMSQLAAIMTVGFGTMSVTERPARGKKTQRNSFFELNYKLVTITDDGQKVTASIPMEQLQLTSSFRQLPNMRLGAGTNQIQFSMTSVPSDVSTLRVVVVNYRGDGVTQAGVETVMDIPVVNGEVAADIPVNAVGKFTVLTYGLIPSASLSKKIDLDNIHTPADQSFISAVELNQLVSDGQMAETMTVGANITVE